jgi:hypothetical protein
MREADYLRDGLPPPRARDAARHQFGNLTHFKEQTHDMWTFGSLENLRQDVRFAVRTLRKSPGFALVAVAALAIGIGGNTAIFSMVDAIRARAMPYAQPDRLVELWGNIARAKVERRGASFPDYLDWRAQAKSFDDMAAFDSGTLTLAGDDEPERVQVEFVAAPYFPLLGVAPHRAHVPRRRRRRREAGGGRGPERWLVEAAVWQRSADCRAGCGAHDPRIPGGAADALHGRRADAARLQGPD